MVFHHSGLIRVVFHHSGLLSGRSCISGPTGDGELCELFIIFYWMLSDAKNNPKYMSLNPVNGYDLLLDVRSHSFFAVLLTCVFTHAKVIPDCFFSLHVSMHMIPDCFFSLHVTMHRQSDT